jgi:hypothetical protein
MPKADALLHRLGADRETLTDKQQPRILGSPGATGVSPVRSALLGLHPQHFPHRGVNRAQLQPRPLAGGSVSIGVSLSRVVS